MEKNLTQGSIIKNVLVFSLPYLLSCFLQTLYGMADLFIAGQFNGSDTITAISVGSQVMHMVTVILLGIAMGTTVLISRAVGAKEKETASKVIANTVIVFSMVAVLLTAVLLVCCPLIVKAVFTPVEAVKDTRTYLTICFAGIPFITAYNIIASIYRGLGDSKTPLIFIAISCVVNIALDFLFMGVFDMGAMGAAWATVIAQALSVAISIVFFVKNPQGIKLRKSDFKLDKKIVPAMLKIGLPIAAQDGFVQISFMVITAIANSRGLEIAAAVGIVEKIICFLFLIPSAMLSSISAIAAQNIGAGNSKRATQTLFCGMGIALGFGLLFAGIFQFWNEGIVSLFTKDSAVVIFGGQYLKSYVFDCVFAAIHFCFSGYFCAWGFSIVSFISNVASILIVRIPGAWLASRLFPETLYPMGWAAPLGSLFSSIIYAVVFVVFWKKKKFVVKGKLEN